MMLIFSFGSSFEECIIEIDDVFCRTIVCIQGLDIKSLVSKLLLYIVKQSPVTRAPAVNALLYITHNEVACILMTHGFIEQYFEVLPLYGAGVLKLVYHDMLQLRTYLLKDKR